MTASHPHWFSRSRQRAPVTGLGQFYAARCAAVIVSPRSNALRLKAVQTLCDLSVRDPRCEQALVVAMADDDPTMRVEALNALSRMAMHNSIIDRTAIAQAVARRLTDYRVVVRTASVRFYQFIDRIPPEVVPDLIAALGDERGEVRAQACPIMLLLGPQAQPAVPVLINMIDDPSPRVGAMAINTLGRMGILAAAAVEPLISVVQPDDFRADAAIVALGRLGPYATPAVPVLRSVSSSQTFTRSQRYRAVAALFAINPYDAEVLDSIEQAALQEDSLLRVQIARELSRYRADEAQQVRIILRFLSDPADRVREEAALSLGRLAPLRDDEIAHLRKLADDVNFIGRQEAQMALGRALETQVDDPALDQPDFPEDDDEP